MAAPTCILCASRSASTSRLAPTLSSPGSRRSVSTVFSRREKRRIRNQYPRPELDPVALFPQMPAVFENKVTHADGSSFYLASASPRSTMSLVKDITNHPLWNPSLTREIAEFDASGRGGRFARRFARLEENVVAAATAPEAPKAVKKVAEEAMKVEEKKLEDMKKEEAPKAKGLPGGYTFDDLDWMSGDTLQSESGMGNATNIRGLKKGKASGKGKK